MRGRGRPRNSQPGTAALRSAGVRACELRHRFGALLTDETRPLKHQKLRICKAFAFDPGVESG